MSIRLLSLGPPEMPGDRSRVGPVAVVDGTVPQIHLLWSGNSVFDPGEANFSKVVAQTGG